MVRPGKRLALALALAGLGGCPRVKPSQPIEITAASDARQPTLAPLVQLELVPSRALPVPSTWRFSPEGGHVAALDEGCHVWALPSGRYAGRVQPGELEFDPCEAWLPAIGLDSDPPPSPVGLHVEVASGGVEVRTSDGSIRMLACDGAGWVTRAATSCRRPIAAAVASPSGDQLALVSLDPVELEVWSLSPTGEPQRPSGPQQSGLAKASSAALLWSASGLIAALRGDAGLELWWWPRLDEPARVIPWASGDEPSEASALLVDPRQRWLWVIGDRAVSHRPGHVQQRTFPFDLGRGELGTAPIGWRGPVTPPLPEQPWAGRASWAVGPATAWVEAKHLREVGERSFDYHTLRTSSVMLGPSALRWQYDDVDRQLLSYAWQWLGVDEGRVRLDETLCEPEWRDEGTPARPVCRAGALPSNCEVLERPIFAPGMTGVRASWIRCSKGRLRGRAGLWPWSGGHVLAQATRHTREVPPLVWGSDAVALWLPDQGLVILDGELKERHVAPDIEGIERAALDAELDRVLTYSAGRYAVISLRDASSTPAIVASPADHAAFDPSGTRLALAWASELAVFELASGRELARWTAEAPVLGLAWRQDAEVLLTGHDRALPELAWDPEHGVRIPRADPAASLLDRLAQGQLDPSWRWSTPDGARFVRVLDGAWMVAYRGTSTVVASDGRYELGERESAYHVHAWSLRERGDLLGPIVPLDQVPEFRQPVLEPFARGTGPAELQLERERWQALVEEDQSSRMR